MTKITIFKNKNHIVGFVISGHSGFAKSGHDIVCAAISSISQSVCLGISEVLKIDAAIAVDDRNGYLKLMLPQSIADDLLEKSQILFETMYLSCCDLAENYSKNIKMEVKNEIY